MAFRRSTLLGIGGFDPQFRAAGDDVDICWRWIDAGLTIGFAPAALVWHHRRSSVRAYFKQQAGYGICPRRCCPQTSPPIQRLGARRWAGVVYGNASDRRPVGEEKEHLSRAIWTQDFSDRLSRKSPVRWTIPTLLEWHAPGGDGAPWRVVVSPTAHGAGDDVVYHAGAAIRAGRRADSPRGHPIWTRADGRDADAHAADRPVRRAATATAPPAIGPHARGDGTIAIVCPPAGNR